MLGRSSFAAIATGTKAAPTTASLVFGNADQFIEQRRVTTMADEVLRVDARCVIQVTGSEPLPAGRANRERHVIANGFNNEH